MAARSSGLAGADAAPYCRIYFVQSLVAGPGPIIDWTKKAVGGSTKALEIRAFGSVFGRLHGAGIASVLCSNDSTQAASKQINWSGEENLFAGWKGIFACGAGPDGDRGRPGGGPFHVERYG